MTEVARANPLTAFAAGLAPILREADRTGLLVALRDAPRDGGTSASELAARCRLHPRATLLVLDALTSLGLCARSVTHDGDARYRSAALFDETLPWSHLGRFLETGEVLPMIDDHARRGPGYAQVVQHLATRFMEAARTLAQHAPAAPGAVVLDVGAGSGVWSLAMAHAQPHADGCTVIGLDLPEVLPRFVAHAQALGVAHRAVTLAGDWNLVEPPAHVDRLVLANVLHLESPADAAALVERFARFVSPGGDIVIIDVFGGAHLDDHAGAIAVACYALHLALRTARGGVHPLDDVRAWCARAGFSDVRLIDRDVLHMPHALVARRSA